MIQGRIFEIKKNIMSKASFCQSGDKHTDQQVDYTLDNLTYKTEDRYYTKMRILMDKLRREHQLYLKTRG